MWLSYILEEDKKQNKKVDTAFLLMCFGGFLVTYVTNLHLNIDLLILLYLESLPFLNLLTIYLRCTPLLSVDIGQIKT